MPPDVFALELTFVGGVQHEPVVIPQWAPREVERPRHQLFRDRPLHSHEEVRVEDQHWQEEHEGVIAGERLPAHNHPVRLPPEAGGSIPRRRCVGPALRPFALDLDAGYDDRERCPEQNLCEQSGHVASFKL